MQWPGNLNLFFNYIEDCQFEQFHAWGLQLNYKENTFMNLATEGYQQFLQHLKKHSLIPQTAFPHLSTVPEKGGELYFI